MLQASGFDFDKAKAEGEKLSREDWTFEEMQEDYRLLSQLESQAGAETLDSPGGYNPLWSVRTDLSINIIREERYKVRRELDYQRDKEAEAERKAREARRRGSV